jgi:hypothetical protein
VIVTVPPLEWTATASTFALVSAAVAVAVPVSPDPFGP